MADLFDVQDRYETTDVSDETITYPNDARELNTQEKDILLGITGKESSNDNDALIQQVGRYLLEVQQLDLKKDLSTDLIYGYYCDTVTKQGGRPLPWQELIDTATHIDMLQNQISDLYAIGGEVGTNSDGKYIPGYVA